MKRPRLFASTIALVALFGFTICGSAHAGPAEAKRFMARGAAAMEMAKSPADFRDAVEEFSQAVKEAPEWADAWFNLGVAQESAEDYGAAIESFKGYLKKAPKASDREAVETRIYKLEYKLEKAAEDRPKLLMRIVDEQPERLSGRISGSGGQEPCCRIIGPFWADVSIRDGRIEIRNLKKFNGPDEDGWPESFSGEITGHAVKGRVRIAYRGEILDHPFEGSFEVGSLGLLVLNLRHRMGVLYDMAKDQFVPAPRTSDVIYTWTFNFSVEDSE